MSENNDLNENSLFSVQSKENQESQPPMPQAPAPAPMPQAPAPAPMPQAPAPAPMPQAPAPAPMPQAAMPQTQGPATMPQAQVPMGTMPQAQVPMGTMPMAQPSPFVIAGQTFFKSMVTMISGFPGKAMKTTANTAQAWIIGLIVSALAIGLFVANAVAAGASTFNSSVSYLTIGYLPHVYDFGFSNWISIFLIYAICGALLVVVKAAILKFSALIMGQTVPYTNCLVVASLAASWFSALLFISGFLLLIAPKFFLILILVLAPFMIFTEIATYIGLLKQAKFIKSPLVPYAVLMPLSYPIAFSLSFIFSGNMG